MPRLSRAWNKNYTNVRMACWNPWGFSNERFNYCLALNYDVLGLTELHNVQNKKIWKCKRWITSMDAPIDEQGKLQDSASGVGILLSKRFSENVLAQGAIGSRIAWVRVKGPACILFIVCVYIPHKFRKAKPHASDTLLQLDKLLADCTKIQQGDCLIVMGDFNCEIQRNIQGVSGPWFMNKRADN